MSIYTIGHSNHPPETLLRLLTQHGIGVVADVRSSPYSRYNPQFNRETLEKTLAAAGIRYLFLGRELGARPDDTSCYENGAVRYDRIAATPLFREGLARLEEGLRRGHRIALMCAEKDPLDCHRTILVSRHLPDVRHIHADGTLEPHAEAMVRLRERHHLPERDLFRSPDEILAEAYLRQEARIAFETDEQTLAARGAAQ